MKIYFILFNSNSFFHSILSFYPLSFYFPIIFNIILIFTSLFNSHIVFLLYSHQLSPSFYLQPF